MAISYGVDTATGTTSGLGRTGDGNLTCTLPTGWAVGQFAIILLYSDQGSGSTPSGWTQASGSPWGSSTPKLQLFYKFLESGEPNPITTISGSTTNMSHAAAVATFNGVCRHNPIDVIGTASDGTGTPMTAGAITTGVDYAWVLGLCGRGDNEAASGQTFGGVAATEYFDCGTSRGNDSQVSMYAKEQATAGTSGAGSATTSVTDPWVSVLVSLRPRGILASSIGGWADRDNFDSYDNGTYLDTLPSWILGRTTYPNCMVIAKPASDGEVQLNGQGGATSYYYHRAGDFAPDQFSQFRVTSYSNDGPAVTVRNGTPQLSNNTCYYWRSISALGDSRLVRRLNGSETNLLTGGAEWQAGDLIRLEVIGNTLYCYRNGSLDTSLSGGTGTYTDGTPITSGSPGISGAGVNATLNTIDDWEGGKVISTVSGTLSEAQSPEGAIIGLSDGIALVSGTLTEASVGGTEYISNVVLGTEMVSNGGFDDTSAWSLGTGWSISGGTLNAVAVALGDQTYQNIGVTQATRYRLAFTISNYSTGYINFLIGASYGLPNLNFNANGLYSYNVTSQPDAINGYFYIRPVISAPLNASVDNISLKPLTVGCNGVASVSGTLRQSGQSALVGSSSGVSSVSVNLKMVGRLSGFVHSASDNFDSYPDGVYLDSLPEWTLGRTNYPNCIRIKKTGTDGEAELAGQGGATSYYYFRRGVFNADQFTQFTVTDYSTDVPSLIVRHGAPAASSNTCYMWRSLSAYSSSRLTRRVSGTETDLVIGGTEWQAGDVVRLEVRGSTLYMYRNGVLDTSMNGTGIYTDASPITSGSPGIGGVGTTGGLDTIDDWVGGNFVGSVIGTLTEAVIPEGAMFGHSNGVTNVSGNLEAQGAVGSISATIMPSALVTGVVRGRAQLRGVVGSGQIIADHTIVDQYDNIPQAYIDEVKKMWVCYAGESHAAGVRTGMNLLEALDPKYAVYTQESGTPAGYTTANLRFNTATWGSYDASTGWVHSYGEEDWWTNDLALSRTKAGLDYCHNTGPALAAIGFGWCYDDSHNGSISATQDPVYGCRWYGRSLQSPSGSGNWGLDAADQTITGNSVCLDTYLAATQEYMDYCIAQGYSTKVFFSTGPVEPTYYVGESGYQASLKHQRIRDYVKQDSNRILFDYADILCYDDDGTPATNVWSGHTFPVITPTNYGDGSIGHIGEAGVIRVSKAMWWMLARMAGWQTSSLQVSVTGSLLARTGSSGLSTGSTSVSGTLRATGQIYTSSSGVALVAGTLNGRGLLQGAISTNGTVSGLLLGLGRLAVSVNAIASVVGRLSSSGVFAGHIGGVASVSGSLSATVNISASINAAANVTGALKGSIIATSSGVSTVTGRILATANLVITSRGVSLVSGTLKADGRLTTHITSTTSLTGILRAKGRLATLINTQALVSADLNGRGRLTGISQGVATCSLIPVLITQAGIINGVALVSGTLRAKGSLSASINLYPIVSAHINGWFRLSTVITCSTNVLGLLLGKSHLSGTITGVNLVSGLLLAKANLAGVITNINTSSAILRGNGSLIAQINIAAILNATLLGEGRLTGLSEGIPLVWGAMREYVPPSALLGNILTYSEVSGNLWDAANVYRTFRGSVSMLGVKAQVINEDTGVKATLDTGDNVKAQIE